MDRSYRLFTWDWKAQPPLAEILTAFEEMIDYAVELRYYLPDTGGDHYACIISDYELSPEEIEVILSGEDE